MCYRDAFWLPSTPVSQWTENNGVTVLWPGCAQPCHVYIDTRSRRGFNALLVFLASAKVNPGRSLKRSAYKELLKISALSTNEPRSASAVFPMNGSLREKLYRYRRLNWGNVFCKVSGICRATHPLLIRSALWSSLSIYPSVCLSICLSFLLSISIYPSVRPSIYLSIYLSACLSIYLSVCLSVCLSIYLSIYLPACLSVFLAICLSVCLSIYLSICLPVLPSIYLAVCLSIYLSIYLSVCLSILLCLSICLAVCLSFFLSIYLSIYLSICLSVCLPAYLSCYLSIYLCLSVCLSCCLSVCDANRQGGKKARTWIKKRKYIFLTCSI